MRARVYRLVHRPQALPTALRRGQCSPRDSRNCRPAGTHKPHRDPPGARTALRARRLSWPGLHAARDSPRWVGDRVLPPKLKLRLQDSTIKKKHVSASRLLGVQVLTMFTTMTAPPFVIFERWTFRTMVSGGFSCVKPNFRLQGRLHCLQSRRQQAARHFGALVRFFPACTKLSTLALSIKADPVSTKLGTGAKLFLDQSVSSDDGLW